MSPDHVFYGGSILRCRGTRVGHIKVRTGPQRHVFHSSSRTEVSPVSRLCSRNGRRLASNRADLGKRLQKDQESREISHLVPVASNEVAYFMVFELTPHPKKRPSK